MRDLEERFWQKVRVGDACWNWTRGRARYGTLHVGDRDRKAHHVSWFLHHRRWPRRCVLHRCDNTRCVRPSHLFLGTQAQNVADMVAKKRQRGVVGERHHRAKLTEAKVREIRVRLARGEGRRALAARFDVTPALIRYIDRREIWRHV